MLVLNRKPGERVIIDGDIVIEVAAIEGRRVKLIFEAPKHIKILRQELVQIHDKLEKSERP